MPIKLPDGLPIRPQLQAEGIATIDAMATGLRGKPPLRIALLNLMPEKSVTEFQIARLLGDTAYPVELTLFVPDGYHPKTTPVEHLTAHYQRWGDIGADRVDGLIVTGAPIEMLPFEQVSYWQELTEVFDWARENVHRSYYICWAAQAALYHYHGVPKHVLLEKHFGVYRHDVVNSAAPLLAGFDPQFSVPVSRHTEVRPQDLPRDAGLSVLADSPDAGVCMIDDAVHRATYMFNHLEYDAQTLRNEYVRDLDAGRRIAVPKNYFPGDDPTRHPINRWRSHGRMLFRNWLAEIDRTVSWSHGPVTQPRQPTRRFCESELQALR